MPNKLDIEVGGWKQDLMDHMDNIAKRLASCVHGIINAGLAIGVGSPAKVLVANTVTYSSKGVAKSKATAEVAFTATVMDIPANAASIQEACYVVGVDGAGTLTLIMGAIAAGSGLALLPSAGLIPDGVAAIGYVRIAVAAAAPGAGTNFVAGTTALSDGRLSAVTYVNWLGAGNIISQFAQAL